MKNITNIRKALKEIAIKLASNVALQKILLVDEYDVESATFTPLTLQQMFDKHYICIGPQNEKSIQDYGKNTFIALNWSHINLEDYDGNLQATGIIDVITDLNHAIVNNYEDRCLETADLIIQTIDNIKLSTVGQIKCSSISFLNYTPTLCGYSITFDMVDTNNQEVEL